MNRRIKVAAFVIASLIGISITGLHAQEQIRPAEGAQLLHRIWMTRGSVVPGNEQIGSGVAGLGDISGDGIGDFAVRWGLDGRWRIYYGADSAPGTTPAWISDTTNGDLVTGDFWGTGHHALCFGYDYESGSVSYFGLRIHRTDHDSVDGQSALVLTTGRQLGLVKLAVGDLDGDRSDDLILTTRYGGNGRPGIWLYLGGPNFQINAPTRVLHDTEAMVDANHYLVVGDFDGDHKPDILTGGTYAAGQQLKFWFSSRHASVWDWDQPDRVVTLVGNEYPRLSQELIATDCDGDGTLDLILPGADGRTYIFRSAHTGKNATTRPFSLSDADRVFVGMAITKSVGYLNDSVRRYSTFGLVGPDPKGNGLLMAVFGGGPNGPDAAYEAFYGNRYDDIQDGMVYSYVTPLTDVNNDGWPDVLIGDWSWYDQILRPGIAMILAGGPYIPRDISLGVRDIAAESRRNALSIWPTPTHDELHVAWRGDLARMPEHFVVHDLLGRIVAEGSTDSWRGAVVWKCASNPAGIYLLTVLDRDGLPIATAGILKE